jgi:hypothetical protein
MKNKIKIFALAISAFALSNAAMAQAPWTGTSLTGDSYRTGNVGIGTSTPEKGLHIFNAADASVRLQAFNGSGQRWDLLSSGGGSLINSGYFGIIDVAANAPRLIINNSGNVGLGTADMPERKLHIKEAADAFIRLQATNNNGQRWDIMSSGGGSLLNSGDFGIIDVPANKVRLAINRSGNVGIGFDDAGSTYKLAVNGQTKIGTKSSTAHSNAMLTVDGKIVCKDLYVTASSDWPDFVFKPGYNVPSLQEIEKYYTENGHLPLIPSEKEILEKGIDVGEMNKLLLQKIEEMTILMVKQEKRISELEKK